MPAEPELRDRVDALARAVELGARWLPDDLLAPAAEVVERAGSRLRHGTAHTVVALAGPTGSGKSTLFNALAGEPLSATGVRRPTTGETSAASWGAGAGELLDWLEVRRRHVVADTAAALEGLVLLDLPDHDSTVVAHRLEVDRLVALVDLLVWVVEPQKYADAALHERYLRPLAEYAPVMRFVLNKADTLDDAAVAACADDLARRLREDGIEAPVVLPLSAVGGTGLAPLCEQLERSVEQRRAALDRLAIDVGGAARALPGVGADDTALTRRVRDVLVDDLARSAGVGAVARATGRRYQREAVGAVGWPPLRLLARRRWSPLAELPALERSDVALAGVGAALRKVGEAIAGPLDATWGDAAREVARQRREEVVGALVEVTAVRPGVGERPRWWAAGRRLQQGLAAVAAVGLVWLVAVALVESLLRLDPGPLLPEVGDAPLPTLVLVLAVVAGLVAALVGRGIARVAAARRATATRRRLRRGVRGVVDEHVTAPLEAMLDDRRRFAAAAGEAAGGAGAVPSAAAAVEGHP